MLVTVACAQFAPLDGDPVGNLLKAQAAIEVAARSSSEVVVLPELALSGHTFADSDDLGARAQTRDGRGVGLLASLACEFDIAVVCGFVERVGTGIFNSAFIADAEGVKAVVRKMQ